MKRSYSLTDIPEREWHTEREERFTDITDIGDTGADVVNNKHLDRSSSYL